MKEFLRSFVQPNACTPYYVSLAGITYPDPNYHLNRQKRKISVIEYIVSGKGYVLVDGRYEEVNADTIYFLSKGEHHEYFADKKEPFTKIFLNISGPFAKELSSLYGLKNNHVFKAAELKPCFEQVLQILNSSKSVADMQIELQVTLCEILTRISYYQAKEEINREAYKVKEHIDSNTDRMILNSELAGLIYRSPDYCQKLFLKEFGITPYQYQINRKIAIAKNMLADTDIPVNEVSDMLGYSDAHYFSNVFKLKVGYSPREYRRMLQKCLK